MTAAKGWAVVTKRGRVVAVGMVRHRVIDEACNSNWRDWPDNLWRDMKAAGYRCIRITIQEARRDG